MTIDCESQINSYICENIISKYTSLLMRVSFIIFLGILLLFFSCTTTSEKNGNTLQIQILESHSEQVSLFGFLGDNQIFIDSISVVDNKISYPISKTCNPGLYRIVFDNSISFDFIYNREDVVLELNPEDISSSFKVVSSHENTLLYDFFFALQHVQRKLAEGNRAESETRISDTLIQEYKTLFTDFLSKDSTTLAHSIIQLLYVPDYEFFSILHPTLHKSKKEYLSEYFFKQRELTDERLLATPYLYVVLNNYLQSCDSSFMIEGLQNIHTAAQSNNQIDKFAHSFLYEYVYNKQNSRLFSQYLRQTYNNSVCELDYDDVSDFFSYPFLSYGMEAYPVPSVDFADNNVSVLLFTDSLCPAHDSVNQIVSVHEKGLQSNGVDVVTISSQNSEAFEKLARQYSVVCVPSVILIDSNGLVQGRMYGKEFSAEYIVQLFKTFYKP